MPNIYQFVLTPDALLSRSRLTGLSDDFSYRVWSKITTRYLPPRDLYLIALRIPLDVLIEYDFQIVVMMFMNY